MSERKAWFCPSCQKHHGPHVDTCPEPAPVDVRPIPGVNIWPSPSTAHPWRIDTPTSDPWVPYWPQITCGGVSFPSDPNMIVVN